MNEFSEQYVFFTIMDGVILKWGLQVHPLFFETFKVKLFSIDLLAQEAIVDVFIVDFLFTRLRN